jgi:hypothetical protein
MASTASVYFFILFIALCIIAFWWAIVGLKYNISKSSATTSYGVNGIENSVLQLSCPVGKKILIEKAKYICNDLDSKQQPVCDWNLATGEFAPSPNTKDAVADLAVLNGKNSGSFTIPKISLCAGCNNSGLIGIYSCVH